MSDESNQNNNSIAEEISEKSESVEKISPENPEEKKAKNRVIPEPINTFEEVGDKTRVSTVSRILDKSIRGESCLVHIYGGNHIGKKFLLDAKEITIGREFGNQIVVDLDNVSRFHAKIYSDLTGVFIKDLDSTNGTFVNDVEISVEKLRNGDLIKIGGGIFKFISGGNVESLY